MPEIQGRLGTFLDSARQAGRPANIVWIGDSLSVLGSHAPWLPLAWRVGLLLSGWSEEVQYLPASQHLFSPTLTNEGTDAADEIAGFGGRSVLLAPGQSATVTTSGEGATVLWTRRPGGGELEVSWGGEVLGLVATDGREAWSRASGFRYPGRSGPEDLVLTARGAAVLLEGAYLHERNMGSGVRVWPAARTGATTRQFVDNPGWVLDSLDVLEPDLVVVATGTNDEGRYAGDLEQLLDLVSQRRPDALQAIWIPALNASFPTERANDARRIAEARGCATIDAAGVLGSVPTHDGVHHTNTSTAICAAHAAGALSGGGEPSMTALAQVLGSLATGQTWHAGVGAMSVAAVWDEPILTAHASTQHHSPSMAFMLPAAARGLLGMPGGGISIGPGDGGPLDLHLSRGGSGLLALNGGAGQIELSRVHLTSSGEGSPADGGVVLEGRTRLGITELVATVDGRSQVLNPGSAPMEVPLPCALGAHLALGAETSVGDHEVVWVPFPAVAEPCVATHVWLHVVDGVPDASVTAAIVAHGGAGLPGAVLASTADGALDLGTAGECCASFAEPVQIPEGARWWVALVQHGGGESPPRLRAAAGLLAGAPVQLGHAPVRPLPMDVDGSLLVRATSRIPDGPPSEIEHSPGPAPLIHISLQAREPDSEPTKEDPRR